MLVCYCCCSVLETVAYNNNNNNKEDKYVDLGARYIFEPIE